MRMSRLKGGGKHPNERRNARASLQKGETIHCYSALPPGRAFLLLVYGAHDLI